MFVACVRCPFVRKGEIPKKKSARKKKAKGKSVE